MTIIQNNDVDDEMRNPARDAQLNDVSCHRIVGKPSFGQSVTVIDVRKWTLIHLSYGMALRSYFIYLHHTCLLPRTFIRFIVKYLFFRFIILNISQ